MNKPASLSSGLVMKKGTAVPALTQESTPSTAPIEAVQVVQPPSQPEKQFEYYKALTVKLDRQRYEALKMAGLKMDKKSQEIFVDALDIWLKLNSTNA